MVTFCGIFAFSLQNSVVKLYFFISARDVVGDLVKADVNSITAFDWLSQLRYYFSAKDNNSIYVRLITAQLVYG